MSKNSYDDSWARCYRYKWQDEKSVTCQGVTNGQTMTVRFPSRDNKESWLMYYCNSVKGCERCPYRKIE